MLASLNQTCNPAQINEDLLDFLEACPTSFHVISSVRGTLEAAGYTELFESARWNLLPGGKYFVTRGESSILAFRIPAHDFGGFMIAASHSDSPSFKLKCNPEIKAEKAYIKLNVEKYGGMLMAPWFDRPLSLAGRVIVREDNTCGDANAAAQNGDEAGTFCVGLTSKLINIDKDLLMIPSLAIHMNREANDGFRYNAQQDMLPIIGSAAAQGQLDKLIAEAAGVSPEDVVSQDLYLYARGRGTVWGAGNEYISAGHLDDLQCSFADLRGFLLAEKDGTASNAAASIPMLAIFDNEEVGSGTKQGADSTFLSDVMQRIFDALGKTNAELQATIASSFMISADNAHAVHPNHPEKADPVNRPVMNKGIVIKHHAGQKYTTDAVSAAVFKELCKIADVPVQEFTNRSDLNGGSTLGNISNAHISLNTVDIGLPQLAMHSPYETAGSEDTAFLVRAAAVFFASAIRDDGRGRLKLYGPQA